MAIRVYDKHFTKLAETQGRRIWSYSATDHILDVMTRAGYFDRVADLLEPGDVIMVDSPGFYDIQRFLGYPPRPVHRQGGGVLQIEEKSESGRLTIRIVGRGLSRFVNAGESAMSGGTATEPSEDTARIA